MENDPQLSSLQDLMQTVGRHSLEDPSQRVNQFTDKAYRDINFVVDLPVRLDDARASLVAQP